MLYIKKNIFKIVIYLSFAFLAANLFSLQIIKYSVYKKRSLGNIIRIIPLQAPRGLIYDRNGKPLVDNRISFDLAVIEQETDDVDKTLQNLSKLCGIPYDKLKKSYKKNHIAPFIPTVVAQDLDKRKAFYIDERITSVPGAILSSNIRRDYKYANVMSHITGYVGKIDVTEYRALKGYGYKVREYVGKAGLEKQYNSYLRGEDGGIQVEVDALSRQVKQLGYKSPQKGKDIHLTVDIDLQELADMLLSEEKGAVIVMDTKKGEILALASSPNFDPNLFVDPDKEKQRLATLRGENFPMLNRAISSAYPPGSTFKVVVASAALTNESVDEQTEFHCSGAYRIGNARFRCWRRDGHGTQNIKEALTHSCNVFFYNVGRLLGVDTMHQYAMMFGLGRQTGVDLPAEASGLVPSSFWKRINVGERWRPGDTLNFAIGQGFLLITPIQALRMITYIANSGFAPRPYLVKRIGDIKIKEEIRNRMAIKNNKFNIVNNALHDVVNDTTGTGQRAKVEGLNICGKTGTAQVTGADEHAWFIGYVPSDNPKVSFIIFLEHGGSGGQKPANMTRVLCKYLNDKGYLN